MPDRHDLCPPLRDRWSPRSFTDLQPTDEVLGRLFEAARWAPSSYNEQPWAFLVVRRTDDAWDDALACLVEANRTWAAGAPVLGFACAKDRFSANDRENRHAFHDVGQALADLTVQATVEGLTVHQMGGFDPGKTRETFGVPDGWTPATAFSIGESAEPMPEDRSRRELSETLFGASWGDALLD